MTENQRRLRGAPAQMRNIIDLAWSIRTVITYAACGGAEHCQVDNRQVGVDYISDWLAMNM